MRTKLLVSLFTIIIGGWVAPTYAGGLTAAVASCTAQSRVSATSIPGDIATAVVRSLLGTAIDVVVTYLDNPKVSTFEVILPVESINDLASVPSSAYGNASLNGKKCLYVSSMPLGKEMEPNKDAFYAKIFFVAATATGSEGQKTMRPVVLEWKYPAFLEPSCPVFRTCSRRDVAVSLAFLSPATTIKGRTVASEPIGFAVVNATAEEIQDVLRPTDNGAGYALPWFSLGEAKGPMNIQFTLVETSQPNAFTTALANAITAQKSAIQDTVDNRLKGVSAQVEAEAKQKNVTTAKTAFDTYKAAYDTATATAQAFASASNEQKNVLRAQYAIQREAAHLTEILAEAAFKQANLDWPNGGLGALPPKL